MWGTKTVTLTQQKRSDPRHQKALWCAGFWNSGVKRWTRKSYKLIPGRYERQHFHVEQRSHLEIWGDYIFFWLFFIEVHIFLMESAKRVFGDLKHTHKKSTKWDYSCHLYRLLYGNQFPIDLYGELTIYWCRWWRTTSWDTHSNRVEYQRMGLYMQFFCR